MGTLGSNQKPLTTKNALIIFTKNPVLGKVKTRLAATIGELKALEVYQYLIKYTKEIIKDIDAKVYVFYSDNIIKNDTWDELNPIKVLQQGSELGERMHNAFQFVFEKKSENAIIIGTDIYTQTTQNINLAFELLTRNNIVINPVEDGGYCLLGLKKVFPELFINKKWSHNQVFNDAIKEMVIHNKKYSILPILIDIDTENDLKKSNFKLL